jgi:hypothetical protein
LIMDTLGVIGFSRFLFTDAAKSNLGAAFTNIYRGATC